MNESGLAIIIAEGGTEKTFFESLIQNTYGFTPIVGKGSICYQNLKNTSQFWLFPIPSLGPTHSGGISILKSPRTYIKAETVITNHSYLFSQYPKSHYFILADSDFLPPKAVRARERKIREAVTNSNISFNTLEIHFPVKEIEAWLMAGLKDTFPYFAKGGQAKLRGAINALENIPDPKAFLDDILDPNLAGSRIAIGSTIGSHFEVIAAKKYSQSFNKFMESIEAKKLL